MWRYPWGQPVVDAHDIRVRDVLQLGSVHDGSPTSREALDKGLRRDPLLGLPLGTDTATSLTTQQWLELVVGMGAPELHVRAMLTTRDVATMLEVSPDTVSAYRHRGMLPDPQAVIGRAPLWSRPIVRHWIKTRPGTGWRTDLYGERGEHARIERAARRKHLRPN